MHKLDVAFCDTNETYGERFAAYLMEHKAKEFTVHLFPEPELFLQKIKNEKFDLVLLGSGFSEFGEQAVLSGMTVLILSENIPERLSEDNSYLQSGRKLTVIFKYQPMEAILHEMMLVIPVNYLIVSYYKNKKRDERAKKLMIEFRDAIQAVAAALLAGYSIEHAWKEAEREIMDLYGKEAMITKELIQMNAEIKLNRNVEEILHDLAVRSGVEEIQSFAEIFGFAKRSGGDFPQIIRTTAARISAKIEVEREVDTVIAGKKLEGKIMSVMPFFILAYLNLASGEFIDPLYGNLAGVLVMSAALLVFVGAMAINRRISDIRV